MPGLDDVLANRRDAKMMAAMNSSQPTINVSPIIHMPSDVPVTIKNFDQIVNILESSLAKMQESLSGIKIELGADGIKAMAKDITVDVSTDDLDASIMALTKGMREMKDAVTKLPSQIKLEGPEMEFPTEMSFTEAKSLLEALQGVQKAVVDLGKNMPKEKDDSKVEDAVRAVETAIRGMAFPVPRPAVQYREDAAHASGSTGNAMLAVRKDVGGTLVDADGDWAPLQTDSSGNLRVLATIGSGGSTQYADGAARGTATGNLMMVDDGTNIQSASGDTGGRLNVNEYTKQLATKVTVSGLVTYVAKAAPGSAQASAAWSAKKIDTTTGVVITWADGNNNYDNVATNLTALTYS